MPISLNRADRACGAYVDTLAGADNIGRAPALLAYSWGYRVAEVSAALLAWAERAGRDPKPICSICSCVSTSSYSSAPSSLLPGKRALISSRCWSRTTAMLSSRNPQPATRNPQRTRYLPVPHGEE